MKFFHIADLHLGKIVHDVQMVTEDQPSWVKEFLKKVDEYQVDAVVISGDVYDRRDPSTEAMALFDRLITGLTDRDKYVFVIPGNHDSAVRIGHFNRLLEKHKIHIAGPLTRVLHHVEVPNGSSTVNFWLMPFVFPSMVADRKVLNRDDLRSYNDAVQALIEAQPIDRNACNVLLAHQNVLANGMEVEHSESETVIGGLGEIEYDVFDAFNYVALGHIHNAQKVGRDAVRYPGCPLYYDFSEVNRKKPLTLVEIDESGNVMIDEVDIPLLHKMRQVEGTLEEVLTKGKAMTDLNEYHIQVILKDNNIPAGAKDKLSAVFGNSLINIKVVKGNSGAAEAEKRKAADIRELSLEEQFAEFYSDGDGDILSTRQTGLIRMILEQQERSDFEYCAAGMKPDKLEEILGKDSDELLDSLIKSLTEVENETA